MIAPRFRVVPSPKSTVTPCVGTPVALLGGVTVNETAAPTVPVPLIGPAIKMVGIDRITTTDAEPVPT